MSDEGCVIGRVVSVSGAQVVFLLNKPDENAAAARAVPAEVGSVVKICGKRSEIIGMIRAVSIPIPQRKLAG